MSLHSLLLTLSAVLAIANAQSPSSSALEPLASKKFTYPNLPYQVTGDNGGIRGPQAGYNLCNSTTEGGQSLCQTMFLNSLADFCLWSSPKPSDTIGASEAYEVAWCSNPGHGTRIIPPGAITGAQWLYAKNYVQVVGFIDQTMVNLAPDDQGGGPSASLRIRCSPPARLTSNAGDFQNSTPTVPTSRATRSAAWYSPMPSAKTRGRLRHRSVANPMAPLATPRSLNGSSESCTCEAGDVHTRLTPLS